MSDCQRSLKNAQDSLKSCKDPQFFDQWADTYVTDLNMLKYKGHVLTVDILKKHLPQSPDHGPEQLRVLDVACGTGAVAQKLSPLGFRQFVGVDGNQVMLDKARETELYQELHLALLGTQPLPKELGQFDVVMMVGALHRKYVPVTVVRELCQATKPGGLVVMTQVNYPTEASFTEELEKELESMVGQGLWKLLEKQTVEHYMLDPHKPDGWICGSSYIYQKTN